MEYTLSVSPWLFSARAPVSAAKVLLIRSGKSLGVLTAEILRVRAHRVSKLKVPGKSAFSPNFMIFSGIFMVFVYFPSFRATKDSPSKEYARNRACAASLPCVDAARRHELMLIRMRDIIANGFSPPPSADGMNRSPRHEPLFSKVAATTLCSRLIQFATQLST